MAGGEQIARAAPTTASARRHASRLAVAQRLPLATCASLLLVVPNVVWIARDRAVWPWDPSWYGEVSTTLWAKFRGDLTGWPDALVSAFGMKPPAIAWFGEFFMPLRHLVGADNALLLSVVAAQALALLLFMGAVHRLTNRVLTVVAGVAGLAGAPLFMQMGHEYFPESLQVLAVTWTLFILSSARRWRLSLTLTQVLACVSFGLLAKLTTPLYQAAAVVGALVLALTAEQRPFAPFWRDARLVASGVLAATLAISTSGWYAYNIRAALAHAEDAGTSKLYGVDTDLAGRIHAWSQRIADAAFLPFAGLAVFVILVAAAIAAAPAIRVRLRGWRLGMPGPAGMAVVATGVTVVLTLAAFARVRPQDPRYLLGAVPALVLLVTLAADATRSRVVVGLIAAVLGMQYALTTTQDLGGGRVDHLAFAGLQPPRTDGAFANALRGVVDRTCTPRTNGRINMVGVDYPWMNSNVLTMYAAQQFRFAGLACYYTALGYAETDADVAWQRLLDFRSPYFVGVDYGNPTNRLPSSEAHSIARNDAFNLVNRAIFRRLERSDLYARVPGSAYAGLVVFQRRDGS